MYSHINGNERDLIAIWKSQGVSVRNIAKKLGSTILIMMGLLEEFLRWLPRYFFPKICFGCGKEGEYGCLECREKVERVIDQLVCSGCGKPAAAGMTHPGCRRRYGMDGLISLYRYGGWTKKMIKNVKFGKRKIFGAVKELAEEIAEMDSELECQTRKDNICVAAIPLHWWRKKTRGFNQAEIIANAIGNKWGTRVENKLLFRSRYTQPQTLLKQFIKLKPEELAEIDKKYPAESQRKRVVNKMLERERNRARKENVEGAFEISSEFKIGRRKRLLDRSWQEIVLVDDVWTTGATMKECCRVLKRAGAKKVWGITLLRAEG